MTDNTFKDNVVIVTGASRGIGAAMAVQLADQGARLALAARDGQRLNAVGAECRQRGAAVLLVETDVTVSSQCQELIAKTEKEYGRIDTLINNAGRGMWARFDQVQDPTLFEQMIKVNYLSAVYCTFYAMPHLKQARGRLVGISSLAGKAGVPSRTAYSASKHAMVGFFDSLRPEVAPDGVSVTVAYPDFVASGARFRNLGPDGKPVQNAPPYAKDTMTSETCAALILRGVARRQREILMTTRGRLGPWAKLIAPGLVDRIAFKATEKGA